MSTLFLWSISFLRNGNCGRFLSWNGKKNLPICVIFRLKKWKKNFGRKFSAKFKRKKDSQRREGFSRPPAPNNLPFGVVTFKRHIRKFKNFNFCLEGYTSQENKDKLTLFSAMYIGFFVQQRHDRCFRALTKKNPQFSRFF